MRKLQVLFLCSVVFLMAPVSSRVRSLLESAVRAPIILLPNHSTKSGSAFPIEKNGKIYYITNAHVCLGAEEVDWKIYLAEVKGKDMHLTPAKIIKYHSVYDLCAIAKPDTPDYKDVKPLKVATQDPDPADKIYTAGYTLRDYLTINSGIYLSNPFDDYTEVVDPDLCVFWEGMPLFNFDKGVWMCTMNMRMEITTSKIDFGMSGGPMVNSKMEVVGVNAQKSEDGRYSYGVLLVKLRNFIEDLP